MWSPFQSPVTGTSPAWPKLEVRSTVERCTWFDSCHCPSRKKPVVWIRSPSQSPSTRTPPEGRAGRA